MELCTSPQPGWNYVLRSYNIVPNNSEILEAIRLGDTDAVLDLFRSGKASPFDKNPDGYSLLEVSEFYFAIEHI